jgi:hypothetical protein
MADSAGFPCTFGIEEEFFLTHPKSRALRLADCGDAAGRLNHRHSSTRSPRARICSARSLT